MILVKEQIILRPQMPRIYSMQLQKGRVLDSCLRIRTRKLATRLTSVGLSLLQPMIVGKNSGTISQLHGGLYEEQSTPLLFNGFPIETAPNEQVVHRRSIDGSFEFLDQNRSRPIRGAIRGRADRLTGDPLRPPESRDVSASWSLVEPNGGRQTAFGGVFSFDFIDDDAGDDFSLMSQESRDRDYSSLPGFGPQVAVPAYEPASLRVPSPPPYTSLPSYQTLQEPRYPFSIPPAYMTRQPEVADSFGAGLQDQFHASSSRISSPNISGVGLPIPSPQRRRRSVSLGESSNRHQLSLSPILRRNQTQLTSRQRRLGEGSSEHSRAQHQFSTSRPASWPNLKGANSTTTTPNSRQPSTSLSSLSQFHEHNQKNRSRTTGGTVGDSQSSVFITTAALEHRLLGPQIKCFEPTSTHPLTAIVKRQETGNGLPTFVTCVAEIMNRHKGNVKAREDKLAHLLRGTNLTYFKVAKYKKSTPTRISRYSDTTVVFSKSGQPMYILNPVEALQIHDNDTHVFSFDKVPKLRSKDIDQTIFQISSEGFKLVKRREDATQDIISGRCVNDLRSKMRKGSFCLFRSTANDIEFTIFNCEPNVTSSARRRLQAVKKVLCNPLQTIRSLFKRK